MKLRQLALATTVAAAGLASALVSTVATAQTKEQFFPVLVYRTGAYAPNGVPFANGYVDYLKLVNARGGINGSRTRAGTRQPPVLPTGRTREDRRSAIAPGRRTSSGAAGSAHRATPTMRG